jgi:rhodanese-related sulfurtransferase
MALNKEAVFKRMSEEKKVVVLNVLPRADYLKLHIKGSASLPLGKDSADFCREAVEKFGKDKHFILYGERFGMLDSYVATRALIDQGLHAENYGGGLREWHRAGLPVEGTETQGGMA